MMVESIEIIHKIWASDPPYRIPGKYWDVTIDAACQPQLGIGPMLKPYQRPYPPLAVSAMSPASSTRPGSPASAAGGWSRRTSCRSATPRATGSSTAPGPRPRAAARPRQWRLARSILVTESDAEAQDYLADEPLRSAGTTPICATTSRTYKLLKIFKPDLSRCRTRR